MPKQPLDHQRKTAAFTFDVNGESHSLPAFKAQMTGAELRQILGAVDQDAAAMRIATNLLAKVASPTTLVAYDSLPIDRAGEVLSNWIADAAKETSEVTLPE